MDLNALAGRNIARIRRALGMRQGDLETLSGVTQQYISGLESGQRNVTLSTLARLAAALGVDPAELLRSTEASASQDTRRSKQRSPARVRDAGL